MEEGYAKRNEGLLEDVPRVMGDREGASPMELRELRNLPRLVVEVDAIPINGISHGEHRFHQASPRAEVYAPDVVKLLERTRTPEDNELEERARALCDRLTLQALERDHLLEQWHELPDDFESRQQFLIGHNINLAWPQLVYAVGGPRTGLPPIRSVKVVHPETGEAIDAQAWLALPDAERRSWCLAPPRMPANLLERQASEQGAVIEKVLERVFSRLPRGAE